MNPLIERLIAIAEKEIGVKEIGGNNKGARIEEYQAATWTPAGEWPWCSAFMCWVLREWLKNPDVQLHYAVAVVKVNSWRCRWPNAYGWEKWAAERNMYVTDEQEPAKAGDIVIFDFSHIGLVVADQLPGKDYIETIEGNTNPKTKGRDSATGDGVYRMQRKTSLVRHYIRLIR